MGTEAGKKAKPIIEGLEEKITPTICLAEIYAKTIRAESEDLAKKQRIFIKERSALAPLDEETAIESAKLDVAMKKKIEGLGLADSVVYATGFPKKS
jgi:hypothetical protein